MQVCPRLKGLVLCIPPNMVVYEDSEWKWLSIIKIQLSTVLGICVVLRNIENLMLRSHK